VVFLLSSLGYWVINWFFYAYKFGITYDAMFRYFFTDPEFPEKIPLAQLLEDMHVQFFLYVTFLLVLSSLFLHKCVRDALKYVLVSLSFLSAAGDILAGPLVYFLGPAFIYLKIAMFLLFQASSGVMLFLTLKLYLTKEKEEPPERSILYSLVLVFAVFTILFALLNLVLFVSKIGFSPESVAGYYAGDPQRFIRPKSLEGLLDVATPHTISMSVYLFALVHFAFFTNLKRKVLISVITLISGLADNFSPFLIRFVSPEFSYLKILSFTALTISMVLISAAVIVSILRHRAKTILYI